MISTNINIVNFVPNKTIIFFDEIQECSKTRASLKYFYLDKRYDVTCSGSLLEIKNYNQDFSRSVLVSFEDFLILSPMNFNEFLKALNKDSLISYIKNLLNNLLEIEPYIHNELNELLRMYLVIGGMPEIVSRFVETSNYNEVFNY